MLLFVIGLTVFVIGLIVVEILIYSYIIDLLTPSAKFCRNTIRWDAEACQR